MLESLTWPFVLLSEIDLFVQVTYSDVLKNTIL